MPPLRRLFPSVFAALVAFPVSFAHAETVTIRIVETPGGEPTPCRVHLFDSDGEPVPTEDLPRWNDHFTCDGFAELDLAPGAYRAEFERGPEFARDVREFEIVEGEATTVEVVLPRRLDLAAEGWRSADLHIHRPLADVPLLAEAEALDYAPVVTWWNDRNLWEDQELPRRRLRERRGVWIEPLAGEDEREGGALLYFGLRRPLPLAGSEWEHPSPLHFARLAASEGAWIDVEKPFWWDVPTWLASGLVDSIGLANNHMYRDGMLENEAWGRARDEERLPPPRGNGLWSQQIYYQVLNAGLRIPPSAGSASGVLPNPVGYNRVYAHVGEEFTVPRWWEAMRAGRVFVTNGPLLRVLADGELPGAEFSAPSGRKRTARLEIQMNTADPVSAIEIVVNGDVVRSLPADVDGSMRFHVDLTLEPGWFLVRAICDLDHTFRFASTGPFYVDGSDGRRVSRAACKFFTNWVDERIARVDLTEGPERDAVLAPHQAADRFFRAMAERANAR